MNPEPIRGRNTHLFFESKIDVESELFRIFSLPRNFLTQNHPPLRESFCVDRGGNDNGIGANCESRSERTGGTQTIKKWRPHTSVARMLIHQNTEYPWFAEKLHRLIEAFFSIEGLNPQSAAVLINEIIHQLVVQGLIHRAELRSGQLENNLRVKFPISDMIDRQQNRAASGDIFPDGIEIF